MMDMKRLLELLLFELIDWDGHAKFRQGFCSLIFSMNSRGIISQRECGLLLNYLRKHRPLRAYFRRLSRHHHVRSYYWKPGDVKHRIKWLKRQIKRLSREA